MGSEAAVELTIAKMATLVERGQIRHLYHSYLLCHDPYAFQLCEVDC